MSPYIVATSNSKSFDYDLAMVDSRLIDQSLNKRIVESSELKRLADFFYLIILIDKRNYAKRKDTR